MPGFVNYKKGCTRLAAASDQVYQLLAHGRCFSPGTPASSTTKTGYHDIAGILLKVALNSINQSISIIRRYAKWTLYFSKTSKLYTIFKEISIFSIFNYFGIIKQFSPSYVVSASYLSPIFEEINQATSHENPLYKKAITFHSS